MRHWHEWKKKKMQLNVVEAEESEGRKREKELSQRAWERHKSVGTRAREQELE